MNELFERLKGAIRAADPAQVERLIDGKRLDSKMDELMLHAAASDAPEAVKILDLLHGAGLDATRAKGLEGVGCLYYAHERNFAWLLAHGCDARDPGVLDSVCSEVMRAGSPEVLQERLEVVRQLLAHGADANACNYGQPIFMKVVAETSRMGDGYEAGRLQLAQLLIDAGGADVNGRNPEGRSVMDVAVGMHNLPMVTLLLRNGARVDDDQASLIVQAASTLGDTAALQALHGQVALYDFRTEEGLSLLDVAIDSDDSSTLAWLLDARIFDAGEISVQPAGGSCCETFLNARTARQAADDAVRELGERSDPSVG